MATGYASLLTPTDNRAFMTKKYIDDADALKLNLTGGTMTGVIACGTNIPTTTVDASTANQLVRFN